MRTLTALTLTALLLVGCGGAPTRTLPNGSPVAVVDADCAQRMEPLYDALRDLDSRMSVGMNRNTYSERLGDVRVAYDQVTRAGDFPSGACFDSAIKLESAFNEYVRANSRWGDCIADRNCTVDEDALPEMQRRWATAGDLLDEVELALP